MLFVIVDRCAITFGRFIPSEARPCGAGWPCLDLTGGCDSAATTTGASRACWQATAQCGNSCVGCQPRRPSLRSGGLSCRSPASVHGHNWVAAFPIPLRREMPSQGANSFIYRHAFVVLDRHLHGTASVLPNGHAFPRTCISLSAYPNAMGQEAGLHVGRCIRVLSIDHRKHDSRVWLVFL